MAHGNHVSGTCCHNDSNKTNPSARSLPPSQSHPWWSNGDERGDGLPAPRKSPNPMERRSTAPFQVQYPDRIVSRSLGEMLGLGLQLFLCFFWCRSSGIAFASLEQKTYAQGIKISEGNGGLPKVSLLSPHGRSISPFFLILMFRFLASGSKDSSLGPTA